MRKPDPDVIRAQDQWLQALGVSRDLLARSASVLPAGTSVSAAAPAPPGKSSPRGAVLKSIAISVPAPLEAGGQQQLTATGTFSDGSTQDLTRTVKWSSSDPTVTVSPGGLAKVGSGAGKVTITATATGSRVTGSITVVIRAQLQNIIVTPQNPLVESGKMQGLTATAVYTDGTTEDITNKVVWKSSAGKVVDFTSDGVCVANEAGTATVTATDTSSQISGSTKITVPAAGKAPTLRKVTISPLNPDIKGGMAVSFKAMGAYSDGSTHEITDKVTWESSDARILAIDSKGVARAKLLTGTGNPLIRGSDPATGLYQSTTAYVEMPGVKSITVSPKNISIVSGDAMPVTAMAALYGGGEMTVNDLVQWTSSDSNVAEMISSGAQVQGRAQGGATIEAFEPTSKSSDTIIVTVLPPVLRSIMVFPGGETIPNGKKLQFTATGFFSDRTSRELRKVKWSSSPRDVVEINQRGEATAKRAGKATITAEDPVTRVTGSVEVTAGP